MIDHPGNEGLKIEGTSYFYRKDGKLRRLIKVYLPVKCTCPISAHVVMEGESLTINDYVSDGQFTFYGPIQSVDFRISPPVDIQVKVTSPVGEWSAQSTLAPTRLWTIYIAQDKHLDYGWIHPVEKVVERINVLTDYYMDAGTRWNFDTSIWVEEYLRTRPSSRREKLLAKLHTGDFEVPAFWVVPAPGVMGCEEMVQMLMYTRTLEKLGIPVRTAMLQEAPSLSWGMATVLAEAGIPYVVKGAYDLRNPHLKERDPYPLSYWEGPDGSRVLLRWDCYVDTSKWGGYGEGYVFWRSTSNEDRTQYVEKTIDHYMGYEHYPFNAILLAGTGFDEYPQVTAVTDFIHWFNTQGWEYPRLVDATWNDFWQDIESQIDPAKVPVIRGDWGTAWEEWPAQMARITALYRRARETVLSAQTLTSLVYRLDPATHPSRREALSNAWRGLLQFDEHDFGGISPDMAEDTYETKATYAHTAIREGYRALESGISTLASLVPSQPNEGRVLLVANPNNWSRDGLVEMVVQDSIPYEVVDLDNNQPVPCQLETRGPGWLQNYLLFIASAVPSFGYHSYLVRRGATPVALPQPTPAQSTYENDFYRLVITPPTGGLDSLFDKESHRELVSKVDGCALNEYLHFSENVLHRSELKSIIIREGTLTTDLITDTTCLRSKLRTTYRLFRHIKRLDITNELYKEPSPEPQASWFSFPFAGTDRQYYYDGAAAILRPSLVSQGGDLLPGSGLSSTAVQSFLAVSDLSGTSILATLDSFLFQFGSHILNSPLADSDPKQPLALSLVMHNFTRNDFMVRQSGQEYFTFRYSIYSNSDPFRAGTAIRFAREIAQDLPRAWITGSPDAPLQRSGSFITVTPGNVIVTGLKVAEDRQGWIMRLWECEGQEVSTTVDIRGLCAVRAWVCNLLEVIQTPIELQDGKIILQIPAYGLKTIYFE